jgi:hypothetical protein
MIISLTASADTYITNKYIDSQASIESNVGKAGTLDLFYLYDEVDSSTNIKELSRILIKFDIEQLRVLSSSIFDSNNFEARLKLHTITTGNPCPSNFTVSVFPLAIPFEEGMGRDVISFADVGNANFLSASNLTTWYASGCEASGSTDDSNVDYYSSLMLGSSSISIESKQNFILGTEDLDVDVKLIVSSTLSGLLENNGLRISFTGSQENDNVSRFVKRFGSRHVKNEYLSPRLEIKFDDAIVDQRSDMVFDTTGSIYLVSRKLGAPANLTLAGGQQLIGEDCIVMQLSTGSYNSIHTGSQKLLGAPITGMYVVPFSIASNDSGIVSGSLTLAQHIASSGSVTFNEMWKSFDGSKIFYTGSLTVGSGDISPQLTERVRLISRCDGPQEVKWGDIFYVKTSFYDIALEEDAVKFSYERQPLKILSAQYRIKDIQSQTLIFDFDSNYTKLSLDSSGNYVNISSTPLPKGRPLTLEFKVMYAGIERIITDENYVFSVKV